MHRAVHRLQAIVHAVHVKSREHALAVVRQVAGGVEEPLLGDVRGPDVLEALLDVPPADVVLHLPLDHAALGVEHGQPGADLVGEAEQVELATQLAVVASLGLLDAVQVLLEGLLGLPGGAVDALQLLVLLVAPPVRRSGAGQLERRDALGRGHVRPAAEVLPGHLALAVHVVVDRQLAGPDLGARTFRCVGRRALQPDQLQLVGLLGQLVARLVVGDRSALEALVLLDDLAHPGLDLLEVLGHERGLHVEVVVEAVLHRRPDAELCVGEQVLDRLGEHVRGRVPQDVAPVGAVDLHRLHLVAVTELVRQVAQVAVDPGRDHVGSVGEQLPRLGARRHRPVLPLSGVDQDDVDVGHDLGSRGLLTAVPDQTPADRPIVSAGRRPSARWFSATRGDGEAAPRRACRVRRGAQRRQEELGGRYWVRTSDLFGVNEARYHCANRPGGDL